MRKQSEVELADVIEGTGTVHIIYGAHQLSVPFADLSVALVKLAYKDVMSIADDVETYLNGKRVAEDVILNVGDRIEFMRVGGKKGQDFWSKQEFMRYSGITEEKWNQLLTKGLRVVQVGDDVLMSDSECQTWIQRLIASEQPAEHVTGQLQIDMERFCVHWAGKRCVLRNTKPFWLFERLARRQGSYFRIDQLMIAVWPDVQIAKNTVQKTASKLQKSLHHDGMTDLLIDGTTNRDNYALVIVPNEM